MTAPIRAIVSLGLAVTVAACTNFYEVAIETPLRPKLDVSRFQRVLVAGFITGGSDEVDVNLETARLLRSQLRNNSQLQVVDADVLPLAELAAEQAPKPAEPARAPTAAPGDPAEAESAITSEEELEEYEHIFANVGFWKDLGEEYQSPLIVTGTIFFNAHQRGGMVTQEREVYDSFGRRQVVPVRTYRDRKGYVLSPKFIFIDGESGAILSTERHREEILYDASQNTPALSSYFELMDRLMPSFLGALSTQSIKGTRILLK